MFVVVFYSDYERNTGYQFLFAFGILNHKNK